MRSLLIVSAALVGVVGPPAPEGAPAIGQVVGFKAGDSIPSWLEKVEDGTGTFGGDVEVLRCDGSPEFLVRSAQPVDSLPPGTGVMVFRSLYSPETPAETEPQEAAKLIAVQGRHMHIKGGGRGVVFIPNPDTKWPECKLPGS